MGLMKFGVGGNGSKNMAVMDYQPLPTTPPFIYTKFESELIRIQSEIPSTNQPMSNKHFDDTKEERKYFTNHQLMCKWDDHHTNTNTNTNTNNDDKEDNNDDD